jgi:anhydro-N-acetylmuramic acid kinase
MSGTSLDGVDVAFCRFIGRDDLWQYEILQAETISYSDNWQKKLRNARNVTAQDLIKLHAEYGRLLGKMAKNFIDRHRLSPGFIASHGHTVFHQPAGGFAFQLGNGAEIAAITGKTVVCDFRTTDIAHGGQGAPLVPVGDHMLFGDYDYCLNLGGFANVSVCKNGERLAWDICPVNIVLNHLSRQRGLPFDKNGKLARKGTTDKTLLKKLNRIALYHQKGPKSLGAEWLDKTFLP